MELVTIKTKLGPVTLYPGERFQVFDYENGMRLFQFLDTVYGNGSIEIYMHDETNDKFCEVSRAWFANRSIRKVSEQ